MALFHLKSALSLLKSDPAARALLLSNPEAFARQAALSSEELRSLSQTAENSLHVFALSSLHRRSQEAGRLAPLTRTALGEAFRGLFEAYAATAPPPRAPAHNTAGFLGWLQTEAKISRSVRQCARFEAAWLRMRFSSRLFLCGLFVLPSVRSSFLAIWWRLGRRCPCQYFQCPQLAGAARSPL